MNFEEYLKLGNQTLKQIESNQFCRVAKVVDDFKKQYLINLEKVSRSDVVPEPRYCVEYITETYILQNNFEVLIEDSIYLPIDYITTNCIQKVHNVFEAFTEIYSKKSKGKIAIIPGTKESFDFIMGINRLMFDTPAIPMFKASVFSKGKAYPSNNKQNTIMHQASTMKTRNTQANNTALLGWNSLD